ncbi:MAG: Uma2 family endonuclease [Myxococcota bacterium]
MTYDTYLRTDDPDAVGNPALIVEVLSETTERYDRGDKWALYRRLPSLRAYALVSQALPRLEVYRRTADVWTFDEAGEGERLRIPELELELDVAELYRGRVAT